MTRISASCICGIGFDRPCPVHPHGPRRRHTCVSCGSWDHDQWDCPLLMAATGEDPTAIDVEDEDE